MNIQMKMYYRVNCKLCEEQLQTEYGWKLLYMKLAVHLWWHHRKESEVELIPTLWALLKHDFSDL